MTDHASRPIPDLDQRAQALEVSRSFIVQAPAGSGKTELLIQRILALLGCVETPEEILAITFTRKAAGEMKVRLLDALDEAAAGTPPAEPHRFQAWERASAVLERDRERNWNLRRNPSRLGIMTIDSFCLGLTRRMPWLARLGDQPAVTEDADALYREAAERLLQKLESESEYAAALEFLLRHLDNRMVLLRELLVEMLAKRDQWLRYLLDRDGNSRAILEEALGRYVAETLRSVHVTLGDELCRELSDLAGYAADNLSASDPEHALAPFDGWTGRLDASLDLRDHWIALAHLVLTGNGALRKRVDVRCGFPPAASEEANRMKERMQELLGRMASYPDQVAALQRLRRLPTPAYSHSQWQALECLVEILPLAVLELREVFRSTGEVDFIEVAGSARSALGAPEAPEDLLLQLDSSIRHILVDEYQDTSFTQYDLLKKLTAGWEEGDGRTLFVVGDPMQSIYRFREADVGLFLKGLVDGIGDVRLEPLALSSNFRSQQPLVEWFNRTFSGLFPPAGDILTGAVSYERAEAVVDASAGRAVTHGFTAGRSDRDEAHDLVRVIKETLRDDPDGTIAVLVRSRTHLKEIIAELRDNAIPFQAQDLDLLSERPVALDIVALTRALLHPGDTVSWLSVLRAPWCGLALDDLLVLTESAGNSPLRERILNEPGQVEMFATLSADGTARLHRVRSVIRRALRQRGRVGLRTLVESAWLSLGGPAVLDETGLADAEQVFALLDDLDHGGDLLRLNDLERGLEKLYASPDPTAGPGLQVMTIHKAKGLEFDTVILPGLGRPPRRRDKSLLRWLEHPDYGLLLAPIPPAGVDEDEIYRSIGDVLRSRDEHETLRLFYVAATRARKRLHLLGHLPGGDGTSAPQAGSLLASVWAALEPEAEVSGALAEADDEANPVAVIRRLPSDWALPPMADPVVSDDVEAVSASTYRSDTVVRSRFSLRSEEGRLIGTVVHRWLEIMASAIDVAGEATDRRLTGPIRHDLLQAGIPADRIEASLERVLGCLDNALTSERGRWILAAHPDHASEVSLSGLINDELVHASIDRTFVDDGVRWVIDYKTSAPESGEDVAVFLDRETELYRPQVATYMELYRQLEPSRPIRGALYFPLVDGWRVVASG